MEESLLFQQTPAWQERSREEKAERLALEKAPDGWILGMASANGRWNQRK